MRPTRSTNMRRTCRSDPRAWAAVWVTALRQRLGPRVHAEVVLQKHLVLPASLPRYPVRLDFDHPAQHACSRRARGGLAAGSSSTQTLVSTPASSDGVACRRGACCRGLAGAATPNFPQEWRLPPANSAIHWDTATRVTRANTCRHGELTTGRGAHKSSSRGGDLRGGFVANSRQPRASSRARSRRHRGGLAAGSWLVGRLWRTRAKLMGGGDLASDRGGVATARSSDEIPAHHSERTPRRTGLRLNCPALLRDPSNITLRRNF